MGCSLNQAYIFVQKKSISIHHASLCFINSHQYHKTAKFHQKDTAEHCCITQSSQDTDSHSTLIHGKVACYHLSPKLTNYPLALCRLHTLHFFSGQISMHCFFSKFKLGFSLSSALLNFWRPHIITDLLEPSLSHIHFRHLKYLYVKRAV